MATITINHQHKNQKPAAKVGDGATMLLYSDSWAGTVVAVSESGKTIRVQRDKAERVAGKGQTEDQRYEYERDPEGEIIAYRWTKRGWQNKNATAARCLVGVREEWRDPTF